MEDYDEDIYEKEFVNRLLEDDEIDDWEAGVMFGYDADSEE